MSSWESSQKKVGRDRPPRVHIKYEVETEGATVQEELPFVMGVLADFVGQPQASATPLQERRFVDITADNFDKVLESLGPRLSFTVKNRLLGTSSHDADLRIELAFKALDDFTPEGIARQVPPLATLLQKRAELANLREILTDRSDDLMRRALATGGEEAEPQKPRD